MYVAVDRRGFVYVTDIYYQSVKVFDNSWNYVRTLGLDLDPDMAKPRGITTDDSCNVIVAENGRSVLIFNKDGELVHSFKTDGAREDSYVTDVCITAAGNIVICGEHRLEMY